MPDKTLPQPIGTGIEQLPQIEGGGVSLSIPVLIQHIGPLTPDSESTSGGSETLPIAVDTSQSFIVERGADIVATPTNGQEQNVSLAWPLRAFLGGGGTTLVYQTGGGVGSTLPREYYFTVVTFL